MEEKMSNYVKEATSKNEYSKELCNLAGIKEDMNVNEKIVKIVDYIYENVRYEPDVQGGLRQIERTILEGKGDCEDQATLAASMAYSQNIKTFLISRKTFTDDKGQKQKGHVYFAVATKNNKDINGNLYPTCNNIPVKPFDTTSENGFFEKVENLGKYYTKDLIKCKEL